MPEILLEAGAHYRCLANRYADAINRADFDDLATCWAPEGTRRVPAPFNILQHGRKRIRDHRTKTARPST